MVFSYLTCYPSNFYHELDVIRLLFEGIILAAAKQINEERSASSIFHLLVGNRNIQTIQDAHIFANQHFYGIYKSLKKPLFDERLRDLIRRGLLDETVNEKGRSMVSVSKKGLEWLNRNQAELPIHYFRGLEYREKAEVFYRRLALIIQTFTNTKRNHFTFIPVIHDREVEQFVRKFYHRLKGQEQEYLETLYVELESLLSKLQEKEAEMFIDRFSGYKHYGKSLDQLATHYNMDVSDVRLLLTGIIHFILNHIEKENNHYQALYAVIADYKTPVHLSYSTGKTYRLFQQGYSPEEIAKLRRLKINTIHDHLAEIALYDPDFPITSFVAVKEAEEILAAMKRTKSFKLKTIKDEVSPTISYFQIRLMLVFQHKWQKEGEHVDTKVFGGGA